MLRDYEEVERRPQDRGAGGGVVAEALTGINRERSQSCTVKTFRIYQFV